MIRPAAGEAETAAETTGEAGKASAGQGVTHADVVEDFFKRGLFVVEVGEVFFFEVV